MKISNKLCFLITFIISLTLYASPSHSSISGVLINSETNKPIQYASVFLSGTTLGDMTNEHGNFEIKNIPNGSYELILSHIAYQFKSITVFLFNPGSVKYKLKMEPRVIQLNKVTVLGEKDEEWEDDFEIFCKYFLGQSDNSSYCKILNGYAINFNRVNDTLIAQADSILRIENKSLGYDLDILLEKFIYNERNNSALFMYKAFFKERSPQNQTEKNEWQFNRLETYYGSFHHFMFSISRNRSRVEGFTLKRLPISGYIEGFKTINPVHGHGLITNHNSLIKADRLGIKQFSFSGYLQVEYKGNKSGLILKADHILVDTLGMIHSNPSSITRYGTWAKSGIADIVPINYRIDRN